MPAGGRLGQDEPMIQSFGRRLLVAFRRTDRPGDACPVPSAPAAPSLPEVEFVAYGEECLLSGRLRLDAERLTDMLNAHDEYQLVDVMVERLDGDPTVEVREVLVRRDELLLVHATGPRGSQARRQRTRQHALALQVGPYHIRGYFHALPGSDPVSALRRRKTMVPLTDAWIEYASGSTRQRRRVGAVVVNREQIDWVVPALDDEVEMPDLPLKVEQGPLLKDFTGWINSQEEPSPA
jgi:hypothetical protein